MLMDSGFRRNGGLGLDPLSSNIEARTLNAPE